jgi:2-polyprenyl-3-methyl-5-hydroxy-6-metoxy-1,4-benzoquinol methylase
MNDVVQTQLLELNRSFYQTVGAEFDRTRQGLPIGMVELAARLGKHTAPEPRSVLDVGCGNGRFARALAQAGISCVYTGLDADARLLGLAGEQTAELLDPASEFHLVDLAAPDWASQVNQRAPFAAVVCLAVLHHFPGHALRQRLVNDMARLLAPSGIVALSTWQFLAADRFVDKLVPWEAIGLTAADVEPGDALLPWNQGAPAIRYVHQLDLAEVEDLASAAHLRVVDSFRADGKEGNLNLYVLLSAGSAAVPLVSNS